MGHHFLPQEYLRQFAVDYDRDRIWMFDKSERSFKLLPIKNVAQARRDYHRISMKMSVRSMSELSLPPTARSGNSLPDKT